MDFFYTNYFSTKKFTVDSERELSLRRHRTSTTKYNRLVHKFRHRSTRLCVRTHVYQIQLISYLAPFPSYG